MPIEEGLSKIILLKTSSITQSSPPFEFDLLCPVICMHLFRQDFSQFWIWRKHILSTSIGLSFQFIFSRAGLSVQGWNMANTPVADNVQLPGFSFPGNVK